jgi:hypothetical protein
MILVSATALPGIRVRILTGTTCRPFGAGRMDFLKAYGSNSSQLIPFEIKRQVA